MSLICIRREHYLSDFKTVAFNRSATPPHESITLMKTAVKASVTADSRRFYPSSFNTSAATGRFLPDPALTAWQVTGEG